MMSQSNTDKKASTTVLKIFQNPSKENLKEGGLHKPL